MNSRIRQLMETHLKGLAPDFPTAWDNVNFKPPDGPFQVVNFLFAEPDDRGFRDSPYTQRGIMTVTLAYPTNQGSGIVEAKANDVRNRFVRGTSLPIIDDGQFKVIIDRTPEITGGAVEEERYIIRVRVRFFAHVDNG